MRGFALEPIAIKPKTDMIIRKTVVATGYFIGLVTTLAGFYLLYYALIVDPVVLGDQVVRGPLCLIIGFVIIGYADMLRRQAIADIRRDRHIKIIQEEIVRDLRRKGQNDAAQSFSDRTKSNT